MKFRDLKSVAHNIAASVSDGQSYLFDDWAIDVHQGALPL